MTFSLHYCDKVFSRILQPSLDATAEKIFGQVEVVWDEHRCRKPDLWPSIKILHLFNPRKTKVKRYAPFFYYVEKKKGFKMGR